MHLLLLLIGAADLLWQRIPDALSGLLLLVFLWENPSGILHGLSGFFLFTMLYFLSFRLFSREVLGYGDVKLFSVLFVGLKSGHKEFVFFSFLSAGIFSLLLLIGGKKKEESFPFAPFILLSFLYFY